MCCVFGQAVRACRWVSTAPPKGSGGGWLWPPEWEELTFWGRGPGVAFSLQGGALGRCLLSTDLVPGTPRGSGAGTQNETGRCGLRPHGAGLTQKAERDGLTTGPGMSRQKLRWQQTAEPSSDLLWAEGKGWEGLPGRRLQLCWDGVLHQLSVSLAWPRVDAHHGLSPLSTAVAGHLPP